MGYSATLLLTHEPTPTRCDEIAGALAAQLGVAPWQIRWYLSAEIPDGYPEPEVESLALQRMLAPAEAVYFTVTVEED
jgi:hypothetical protein